MVEEYKIGELAEKSGISKRTIHYYLSRELLPPPKGAGPRSFYTRGHLLRLELLKELQARYWPLDKIREYLNALSDEEVDKELRELREQAEKKRDGTAALEFSPPDTREDLGELFSSEITEYLKIDIACGVSLLFPKVLPKKQLETVLRIARYARRLLLEENNPPAGGRSQE